MNNALQYLQKVRSELLKVTWPTRRETFITTGLVFVMVFVACIFFLIVDQLEQRLVAFVLGVGR